MRILTIQERIELGQAKNQSSDLMIAKQWSPVNEEYFEEYKKLVRQFLKANTELDSEIMETGKEQQQPSSKTPLLEPQQDSQSPSNYPEHPIKKFGGRI